jgi:hypothetical protein
MFGKMKKSKKTHRKNIPTNDIDKIAFEKER